MDMKPKQYKDVKNRQNQKHKRRAKLLSSDIIDTLGS